MLKKEMKNIEYGTLELHVAKEIILDESKNRKAWLQFMTHKNIFKSTT